MTIDLSPFERCAALAERADFLRAVTGWETRIVKARDGYVIVAKQFVVAARTTFYVTIKVSNAELSA